MSWIDADGLLRTPSAPSVALPFRRGGFGTICMDPPWWFEDQGGRMLTPYKRMRDQEILSMPIEKLGGDRSHAYCWTTDAHLELALECLGAWRFAFKRTIVWVKTTTDIVELRRIAAEAASAPTGSESALRRTLRWLSKAIGQLKIGGGHWVRGAHEICIFGVRGRAKALVHDIPTVIIAPHPRANGRIIHSAKPAELQNNAERMSPGPRIELFARRQRPGWLCWGDQCPVMEAAAA